MATAANSPPSLLQHAAPGARDARATGLDSESHRDPSGLLEPRYARQSSLPQPALPWSRAELAGRLVELSTWGDAAALTLAFELIAEAQQQGEPAVWIAATPSTFYPPDAARSGIDLDALPVVRVADAHSAARAADKLVRSGAFGLVVIDVGGTASVPAPLQTRLLGLAAKHDTAVVFLTEKQADAASLGSLVSLRAQACRRRTAEDRFSCEARIIKDKRRGPGWSHSEIRHGPAGLR